MVGIYSTVTPSIRETDIARIKYDDNNDPRSPPRPPTPPRRAALCRSRSRFHRPASSTYLSSRAVHLGKRKARVSRAESRQLPTAILSSSRDHGRGFVRRAARKLKFVLRGFSRGSEEPRSPYYSHTRTRATSHDPRIGTVRCCDES